MNESSRLLQNAAVQSDKNGSSISTVSAPAKRTNSFGQDRPDDAKRRKMEWPEEISGGQSKLYFPIASLKPTFACPKIKGTLTAVSEWTKRGRAEFLTFRLKDESGEISGIAFTPMDSDFVKNFKLGATVVLERAKVESSKVEYQALMGLYRLMLNRYCSVRFEAAAPVPLDSGRKMIRDVHNDSKLRDVVDVLGILVGVGEVSSYSMREIQIVDESEANIVLTLWDKLAKNFVAPLGSVISARRVAVRVFNDAKTLRTCQLSKLLIDPPTDDARSLKEWYGKWAATWLQNDGVENSAMLSLNTSPLPEARQARYTSISAILEERAEGIFDTLGEIVTIIDTKSSSTATESSTFESEFFLQHDNSKILVRAAGKKSPTISAPIFSFAVIRNAKLVLDGTRKLLCDCNDVQIIHDASEVERLLGTLGGPKLKKIRRETPTITETETAGTSAAISRVEAREVSSSVVEMCSAPTGAEVSRNLAVGAQERSPKFVATSSTVAKSNFAPISTIDKRTAAGRRVGSNIAGPSAAAKHTDGAGFTPIHKIHKIAEDGSKFNVAGLVIACEPAQERRSRVGKLSWMRIVVLLNENNCKIEVSIWGDEVLHRSVPINATMILKNATAQKLCGRVTLSCLWSDLHIEANITQTAGRRKLVEYHSASMEASNSHVVQLFGRFSSSDDFAEPAVFTTIREIKDKLKKTSTCDVIGLVVKREPAKKRRTEADGSSSTVIVLADDKDCEIEVSVSGKKYFDYDIPIYSVVIVVNATVQEHSGKKTLSCLWVHVNINPKIPQAARLKEFAANYPRTNRSETSVGAGVPGPSGIKDAVLARSPSRGQDSSGKIVFTPIGEIKSKAKIGAKYNIAGVIVKVEESRQQITKAGNLTHLRVLVVADAESSQIKLTVWGAEIDDHDVPLHSAIVARNAFTREFNCEITLSCTWSNLQIDPNVPQAAGLKKRNGNRSPVAKEFSSVNYSPFKQIKKETTAESKWNVIGFVGKTTRITEVRSRAGRTLWKSVVRLKDDNGETLEISVWFNELLEFDIPLGSVMAVKGVRARSFQDALQLQAFWSNIVIDPDIPAARKLREGQMMKACSRWPDFRADICDEFGDYTPIAVIKRRSKPLDCLNFIGLVVNSHPPEERERCYRKIYVRNYVLRGRDHSEVELNVCTNTPEQPAIPLHSVIIARGATLHFCEDERKRSLTCRLSDIEIDVEIPETKGFKEAALSAPDQPADPAAPDPNDFTAIKTIKEKTPMGTALNVVGLVVDGIERVVPRIKYSEFPDNCTRRIVLRGVDRELIPLRIRNAPETCNWIKNRTVIAVRDATLRMSDGVKMLWCMSESVEIDPAIPQTEGLKKLAEIPFVRSFMPFTTIVRDSSLIGCKMDFIGRIIEVLPTSDFCNAEDKSQSVRDLILRNEVDIKLRVWGYPQFERSMATNNTALKNTVVAARNAPLVKSGGQSMFNVDWRCLIINPEIPKDDRGARSLAIWRIEEILESARDGDKLGILAVVDGSPRKVSRIRAKSNICEELSDEEDEEDGDELAMECIKLVDWSDEPIYMTIPPSVAHTLKESAEKHVAIRAWDVRARRLEGELELACSSSEPQVEINPETKDARELLRWYADCHKENEQLDRPVTSIGHVLESVPCNATASVMGILVGTDMQKVEKRGRSFTSRRIELIDETEKSINLLLWNRTAENFRVPLYSVVLVRNFRVYTKNDDKWGAFESRTVFVENPSDEENTPATERLRDWFARYWTRRQNSPDVSAAGNIDEENSPSESSDEKTVKSSGEKSKRLLDLSNSSNAMDCDSSSPDLFADC